MLKIGDYVYRKYYPNSRGKIIEIVDNIAKVKQKSEITFQAYINELEKIG